MILNKKMNIIIIKSIKIIVMIIQIIKAVEKLIPKYLFQ